MSGVSKTGAAFKYTVSLTHVATGETVEFTEDYGTWDNYKRGDDWETDPVFGWADGNFSCNCNRHLFFWRAKGIEPEDDEDTGCLDYPDYRVNWIRNEETGNIIYEELARGAEE
jgi:hypothetical protein